MKEVEKECWEIHIFERLSVYWFPIPNSADNHYYIFGRFAWCPRTNIRKYPKNCDPIRFAKRIPDEAFSRRTQLNINYINQYKTYWLRLQKAGIYPNIVSNLTQILPHLLGSSNEIPVIQTPVSSYNPYSMKQFIFFEQHTSHKQCECVPASLRSSSKRHLSWQMCGCGCLCPTYIPRVAP